MSTITYSEYAQILNALAREAASDHIAYRSSSVDASEREANVSHGWVPAEVVVRALEDGLYADAEVVCLAATNRDAEQICLAAEQAAPVGYQPMPAGTHWRLLSMTVAASGCRAGTREVYVWPQGGW